jgi:cytochrome c oxidase cbb3-type subunit 3
VSDFFDAGWGYYIAAASLAGIAACLWLLFSQRKAITAPKVASGTLDTGHVWDEDLRELNNPLPRWWMWMFLAACAFGVVYLILYPGLGRFPGLLQWTTRTQLVQELAEVEAGRKPIYSKYERMSLTEIAHDPDAHQLGQRLFLNHCAQCHGSDARGSKGFPNLTDKDWLYGGDPETIVASITQGRNGVMPPFKAVVDADMAANLAHYVRSLSQLSNDPAKAAKGREFFQGTCAACHGLAGHGNTALGAPNLTDTAWLYGSSIETITETILNGRSGVMPAHEQVLSPEQIRILAAFVWSQSNVVRYMK